VADRGAFGTRYGQYLDRCFSLTRYLSVNGQQIQPQRWSQFEADPQTPPHAVAAWVQFQQEMNVRPDFWSLIALNSRDS